MDTKKITVSNKDLDLIMRALTAYGKTATTSSDMLKARLLAKKLNNNNN